MDVSATFKAKYKSDFDFEREFERLTGDQKKVIQHIIEEEGNLFLTGCAGTGKSEVIRVGIELFEQLCLTVAITASTGAAAARIGGSTVHSWGGIGICERSAEEIFEDPDFKNTRAFGNIMRTKVLIVDECSMLSVEAFEILSKLCGLVHGRPETPFGGLRVIFVGDFFQLPPVREEGKERVYIFERPLWKRAFPKAIELKRIFRQESPRFIQLLSNLRTGDFNRNDTELLRSRVNAKLDLPEGVTPPVLYVCNENVDKMNAEKLKALPGEMITLESWFGFKNTDEYASKWIQDKLLKKSMLDKMLALKPGAVVRHTVNKFEDGLHNGSFGVVRRVGVDEPLPSSPDFVELKRYPERRKEILRKYKYVEILWEKGFVSKVFPHMYKEKARAYPFAEVTLYHWPLKLAWAVTIHKSQGATFDFLVLSTSRIFEPGMHYTALSRVRSLEGLCLLDFAPQRFQVSPKVIEYYNSMDLKQATEKTQEIPKGFITAYFETKKKSGFVTEAPAPSSSSSSSASSPSTNTSSYFQKSVTPMPFLGVKRKAIVDLKETALHPAKKQETEPEVLFEKGTVVEVFDLEEDG